MRKQRRAEKSIQVVIYLIEALALIFLGVMYGYHGTIEIVVAVLAGVIIMLSFYLVVTCKALYDTREGD